MNIVSIDFDIIMAPSIELYRSFNNKIPYDNYYLNMFNADLEIYSKLTNWLLTWIPQIGMDNIYFIESHEQIIDFLPKNDQISLINIDHHHDMGYNQNDFEVKDSQINCGNWGLYLLKNNLINDYTWIKNGNSIRCSNHKYYFNSKCFYDYNLNNLKPDRIIICLSSPWVPKQYYSLFNLWIDMASKLNNIQYYLIENK